MSCARQSHVENVWHAAVTVFTTNHEHDAPIVCVLCLQSHCIHQGDQEHEQPNQISMSRKTNTAAKQYHKDSIRPTDHFVKTLVCVESSLSRLKIRGLRLCTKYLISHGSAHAGLFTLKSTCIIPRLWMIKTEQHAAHHPRISVGAARHRPQLQWRH